MLRKTVYAVAALILCWGQVIGQTEVPNATVKSKDKEYDGIITAEASSSKGIIDIHLVKNTLYLEIPIKLMGKPMLFASKVSQTSNNRDVIAGQMPIDPFMIEWSYDSERVYIHENTTNNLCDPNESIFYGFQKNNITPILKAFPIKCFNADSSAIVIDVTKYFVSDEKPFSPFLPATAYDAFVGTSRMTGSFKQDMSSILSFNSFPQNFNITTRLGFVVNKQPFTAVVTSSMVLLPEVPMKPRYADRRVGYFTDDKKNFTAKENYIKDLKFINRWRLEPKEQDVEKHKNGELVEPKNPIVYYLDPSFPQEWRSFMKEGVEDWQMAFERAGFKNAIIAKDFPTDDPNFNPSDIRYSCIVYATSHFANAMGPSWTDPRSGEILQGAVYVYHNVLSLLHNWRFIQTATVDPKARDKIYGMDVMGPLLRYLIAHEIGHTIGLMHNMRGSYAIPTDSLRSVTFTNKYGTTSSIMDYARYNYVAQPGDGVTQFLPPRIGEYDKYAIKYGYAKLYEAETPEQEREILNSWVTAASKSPIYKFGEQAIFGQRDPASQSESLGDDAVKASNYGIKNLKIIVNNLLEWTAEEGETYDYTSGKHEEIQGQFKRYIKHCMLYLGGYYINYSVKGDGQQEIVPISRKKQKEALNFILEELYDYPNWIMNRELALQLSYSSEKITEIQKSTLRSLLDMSRLGDIGSLAQISKDPYTQEEYLEDIYKFVWNKTNKNKALNETDKVMQYVWVHSLLGSLQLLPSESSKSKLTGPIETAYQTSMNMSTRESNFYILSKPLFHAQISNAKAMLEKAIDKGVNKDKEYYKYLLFELENLFNK